MAKEYLKGKNKFNTTTKRDRNIVFGKTSSNPLENAEITFDFIEAVAEQVSAEVTGDFVTVDDAQTITAVKTHSANIAANAGITVDTDAFTVTDTTGSIGTKGDLTFTETVTSPATSATYKVVGKQLVHTVSGGATEVIPINIPVGARIIGAQIIVSTVLAFTTGTEVTPTWTASTQQIGSTTLAAKNSKVTALYDQNAESAIVSGAVETITLTADAGTVDSGVVVVTAWYEELTDLTDVA